MVFIHRYSSQHLETRRSMVFIHRYTSQFQKLGGAWFSSTQIYFSASRNQEEHGFYTQIYFSVLETRRSMVSIHTDILLSIQKLGGAMFPSTRIYFSASRNQEEHGFYTHRYSASRNQEDHGFYTHRYTSHLLETRRSMVFIHKDILLSIQKQEGTWFPSTQIYF